jgi:hypothetical protein
VIIHRDANYWTDFDETIRSILIQLSVGPLKQSYNDEINANNSSDSVTHIEGISPPATESADGLTGLQDMVNCFAPKELLASTKS